MTRYFNRLTKTESIEGVHVIDKNCVQLPDDHFFWKSLPHGKEVSFDHTGLPILIDTPLPGLQAREEKERAWRDAELKKVVAWMDQLRNDLEFGTDSFKPNHTMKQLNAYRVALCEYPGSVLFPDGNRPKVEDFPE